MRIPDSEIDSQLKNYVRCVIMCEKDVEQNKKLFDNIIRDDIETREQSQFPKAEGLGGRQLNPSDNEK